VVTGDGAAGGPFEGRRGCGQVVAVVGAGGDGQVGADQLRGGRPGDPAGLPDSLPGQLVGPAEPPPDGLQQGQVGDDGQLDGPAAGPAGVGPGPLQAGRRLPQLAAPQLGRAGRRAAAPPAPVAPGGPPPAPVPGRLVGRRRELRRLEAAWADARAGRRRIVLVAGETGTGKTRLATELAALAERDAAAVLAGRCDQYLGVA
jgi:AAA ATPase domain